jgi:hypothetical protein
MLWMAWLRTVLDVCCRQHGKERARDGDARLGSDDRGGGHGYDHDDDASSMSLMLSRRARSRYRGQCFDRGERGHMARDCREKKEKALLADVD